MDDGHCDSSDIYVAGQNKIQVKMKFLCSFP